MNKQLLRHVHEVKYRETAVLIGQRIAISSLDAIAADVAAAVQPYASSCVIVRNAGTPLHQHAGYFGEIQNARSDLCHLKPVLSCSDRVDRKLLESLGFVSSKLEMKTMHDVIADVEGQDPTFMADMVKEARAGNEWLKVFLDVWPRRDARSEYMEAVRKVRQSGVGQSEASHVAFDSLLLRVGELFPGQFQIRDACVTNSDFVWFNKHFYM